MQMNKLTPNVMVEDVNRNIEFYRDVLGFELLATTPQETGLFDWAMMKNGSVEMMFQLRASLSKEYPVFQGREIGGALTLYIEVVDVKAFLATINDKVKIVQDLHITPYNMQEFAILDCNGFVITFAQSV